MRARWWQFALMCGVLAVSSATAAGVAKPRSGTDFHVVFRTESADYVSVSCVRVGLCLAVGYGSAAAYSDGRWRIIDGHAPSTMDARSVSCVASGKCMATGGRRALLYTVHPGRVRWREVDIPLAHGADRSASSYPGRSVDCVRVGWCMAVGGDAVRTGRTALAVSVWNGRRWRSRLEPVRPPRGGLDGQSVSCWAVGECRITAFANAPDPVVVRAHVLRWSHAQVTDSRPFGARSDSSDFPYIACTSADHCMALGGLSTTGIENQREQTAIWDGRTWTHRPSHYARPVGAVYEPTSLSCLRASLCVTTGIDVWFGSPHRSGTGIEVWSGRRWTLRSIAHVPKRDVGSLGDITCPSARRCFAVGSYGTTTTDFGYVQAGHVAQ